jgi:hypothetical protein
MAAADAAMASGATYRSFMFFSSFIWVTSSLGDAG